MHAGQLYPGLVPSGLKAIEGRHEMAWWRACPSFQLPKKTDGASLSQRRSADVDASIHADGLCCGGHAGDGCAELPPRELQALNKELADLTPVVEALSAVRRAEDEVSARLTAQRNMGHGGCAFVRTYFLQKAVWP